MKVVPMLPRVTYRPLPKLPKLPKLGAANVKGPLSGPFLLTD
jgi:hypothetical protein